MKAKIKSTKAFYPTRNGELAYITREIYKWNLDFDRNIATPIIREQIYVLREVEGVEVREIVDTLREYSFKPFKESDINNLFKALQNPIETTEDFMSELKILLQSALLIDTRAFEDNFYGLEDNELEVDND